MQTLVHFRAGGQAEAELTGAALRRPGSERTGRSSSHLLERGSDGSSRHVPAPPGSRRVPEGDSRRAIRRAINLHICGWPSLCRQQPFAPCTGLDEHCGITGTKIPDDNPVHDENHGAASFRAGGKRSPRGVAKVKWGQILAGKSGGKRSSSTFDRNTAPRWQYFPSLPHLFSG